MIIRGSTVWGNAGLRDGDYRGNGIYILGSAQIERSIISGNCDEDLGIYSRDVTVSCSAIDTLGVFLGEGAAIEYIGENVFDDPLFCDPLPCDGYFPSTEGDYSLQSNSPCLPENSPCGSRIGALGEGCSPPDAVEPTTWGGIKALYRR
jgi:hypothetical protein